MIEWQNNVTVSLVSGCHLIMLWIKSHCIMGKLFQCTVRGTHNFTETVNKYWIFYTLAFVPYSKYFERCTSQVSAAYIVTLLGLFTLISSLSQKTLSTQHTKNHKFFFNLASSFLRTPTVSHVFDGKFYHGFLLGCDLIMHLRKILFLIAIL